MSLGCRFLYSDTYNEIRDKGKEMKHTWKIQKWESVNTNHMGYNIVSTKKPVFVPKDEGGPYWEYDVICENITEAHAQHIVSCANACEGINPEAVPDLLGACKYVLEQMKDVKGKTFPIMPILNAIAKATGEVTK